MKILPAILALACALALRAAPAPLVLISLDGFRWDYCQRHPAETPRLRQLIRDGVTARALIPVYPTNTFPNHYSIVTGLYPSHHGIINNHFFDPQLGALFGYNRAASVQDSRWWLGEPIWVTAGRQGRRSASSFWVGSEAAIGGRRPDYWKPYDYSVPFAKRLDELRGWLRQPADTRPAIVTFYFEETNSAGHNFGPESPELVATLRQLDTQIGEMIDRFVGDGIAANFVIVSDHGMTPCVDGGVVVLEDILDLATVQLDFEDSAVGLRPLKGDATSLLKQLAQIPHGKAYALADLPARFHMSPNPRHPPVWIVPDEGWRFQRRAQRDQNRDRPLKGQHGYDPAFESMRGIFIAQGPAFKSGVVLEPFENVHIYNLLCAALGLKPAPNDGDDRLVKAALR
jgi:predicted AlkP superfamily pyrophosphatase or phosphodiesterase